MKSRSIPRLFKSLCPGLVGSAILLGVLYLLVPPKITKIGEGVSVIQFLNGGGRSWLIEPRGEGGPTITELTDDKNTIVEVRTVDGLRKSEAWVSPVVYPEAPFPATREELDDACLLVWRFQIPDDLAEGEYATTEWRIGDEIFESGLSFEEVAPGQTAMVLLWTGDFMQYLREGASGDPPDGMPYCIRYPGTRKSPIEKWGRMKVPKGWETAYGNLGSGDYLDSGWLMLQSNDEEAKTQRYFAFLELVYRFKSDSDAETESIETEP